MDATSIAAADHSGAAMPPLAFALGSAALYTVSMVAMKLWGSQPATVLGAVIAIALIGAVALEIGALRDARLGMVYVAILGAEVVMLAAVCHFAFGETLSLREALGAGLIVAGTALAWT